MSIQPFHEHMAELVQDSQAWGILQCSPTQIEV